MVEALLCLHLQVVRLRKELPVSVDSSGLEVLMAFAVWVSTWGVFLYRFVVWGYS